MSKIGKVLWRGDTNTYICQEVLSAMKNLDAQQEVGSNVEELFLYRVIKEDLPDKVALMQIAIGRKGARHAALG